jgi:hypothetical protein
MTIALEVASAVAGGTGGGMTGAINTASTTNPVNCIALAVTSFSSGGYTVSDNQGNTANYVPRTLFGSGLNTVQFFYCMNPTLGASHQFTVSGGSTFSSIAALAFSAVNGYEAENGHANSGSFATIQVGSVSPLNNGSLILILGSTGTPATSIDSGFSTFDVNSGGTAGVSEGLVLAHLIQATKGALNPTITYPSSQGSISAAIAVFSPAGGAPTRGLFRTPNLSLGAGGSFFSNPLQRSMLGWRKALSGLIVPNHRPVRA